MNLDDYIANIQFKYIKPILKYSDSVKDRLDVKAEILNTILPENQAYNNKLLYEICKVNKMSTFAIGSIINKIVKEMSSDNCFLNVGVWYGFTYFCGIEGNFNKKCIGIDNFSEFNTNDSAKNSFYLNYDVFKSSNTEFFEMDYEEYFESQHDKNNKIGFYIYDGEHSYENQLKGLQVAEEFFSDDCIILVDDTNVEHVKQANLDFISQSKNNYKMIADLKTANNCHPTFWNGIMLFKKD